MTELAEIQLINMAEIKELNFEFLLPLFHSGIPYGIYQEACPGMQ